MILTDPTMYFGNWSMPSIGSMSSIFSESFDDGVDSGKFRLFCFRVDQSNFFENML